MKRLNITLLAAMLSFPATAQGGTCIEAVKTMATKYKLSTKAPVATLRGNQLVIPNTSQSDGVIRPPNVDPNAVISPPPLAQTMPTAPRIEPDIGGSGLTAGQRSRAEAMLFAARSAAERGDDQKCYDRLDEARQILAHKYD